MLAAQICAAPGCDNPVGSVPGRRGRPQLYCSVSCRPSRQRAGSAVVVELEQLRDEDERHARAWTVRLRRSEHLVIVAEGLGPVSAAVLAKELRQLLHPTANGRGRDRVDVLATPEQGIT